MSELIDYKEQRMLDEATLLEKPHLTSRQAQLLKACTQLAVQEWFKDQHE